MDSAAIIAIVDDDEPLRMALANLVGSYGFGTETFRSAENLIALGNVGDFGALLTDFRLPGLDGISLARALATSAPALPIILMSATMDAAMAQAARSAGIATCLAKPFAAEALIDALSSALARPGGPAE